MNKINEWEKALTPDERELITRRKALDEKSRLYSAVIFDTLENCTRNFAEMRKLEKQIFERVGK